MHTFPTGTPATIEVTLTVTNPDGQKATKAQQLSTTPLPQPSISGMAADPPAPAFGQEVKVTAAESVAKEQGSWQWTVTPADGGTGGVPPTTVAANTPITFIPLRATTWHVTLRVTFDGLSDQKRLDVISADKCTIHRLEGSPVDLRPTGTQVTLHGRTQECYLGQAQATPRLDLASGTESDGAPWSVRLVSLSVGPEQAFGVHDVTLVVQATGNPPDASPANPGGPDAIAMTLPNGQEQGWFVRMEDPAPIVPRVITFDPQSAVDTLTSAGFNVTQDSHVDATACGTVTGQTPAGGRHPRGSTVHIDIGVAPPPPAVCN
jgi:hypothetical protein